MANINQSAGMAASAVSDIIEPGVKSDAQLIEMFKRWKRESFDQRWVYERQWMRNVWYILNRQWIYYDTKRGQWQDKRLAKWVPRPVTNVTKEAVQAVRSSFASINYATNARPIGNDAKHITTAGVADDYAPILHDVHRMDDVMNEFDFWLLTCGNAWLHTCINYDRANGIIKVAQEQCTACQKVFSADKLAKTNKCPECGGTQFVDVGESTQSKPSGYTIPLSPFEIAFPLIYERYDLSPYTIRMRWRDKTYYEQHPEFKELVKTIKFSKSPSDRTMQIFKTLPFQNDLGLSPAYFGVGGGTATEAEGITEFDVWVKPCDDFPEGQVIRFAGDGSEPMVIHSEQEALPGPLPYHEANGNPLFPFSHAEYDHVGGRSLGSSLIDPIIQKQDQLNQVDSLMLMIIMRVANPIWLEPKGAEVEKFSGEPGLVVKWNPLTVQGGAKPERIPGENIPASLFQYRTILKQEIEELSGTFDILKGERPSGVEAFASMNFLLEQGQKRHTSAFKSRGKVYKHWFKCALELEREFGEETRTRAVMAPNREWTFETFKNADLSGTVDIIIEDGTMSPKTALGERAAIEHANQLGILNRQDPGQMYKIYEKLGITELLPDMDAQVQEAWMVMSQFEQTMLDSNLSQQYTTGVDQFKQASAQAQQSGAVELGLTVPKPPNPLQFKKWYNPPIHRQEVVKWCVSDKGRNVFATAPAAIQLVSDYIDQIDAVVAQQQAAMMQAQQPNQGGGAGQAQQNSNRNAAGVGKSSSGAGGAKEPAKEAA